VKTAYFKELAPYDSDWLYTRAASVAYQLYIRGKVGLSALKTHYGGKARRGAQPPIQQQGAGKVIRYCLKQLEEAGLVGQVKYQSDDGSEQTAGKTLTKKGTTDMDRIASQIVKEKKKAQKK
jgi:small subunit ribosomal protein S19e